MSEYNPRRRILGMPNPKCSKCGGAGRRIVSRPGRPQIADECLCMTYSRILQNINKTWAYMHNRVRAVDESPLLEHVQKRSFLRITANQDVLAAHLKCVMMHHCLDTTPYWWVEVTNDKEIVHAWLYTAKMQGVGIVDADIATMELDAESARTVKDLALRADLMIIQVGKKHAANKDTKTTIREVLDYRIDLDKPVWIVDTTRDNLDNADLLAYSEDLMNDLAAYNFLYFDLSDESASFIGEPSTPEDDPTSLDNQEDITHEQQPPARRPTMSLSAGSGGTRATHSAADLQAEEDAKQRASRKKPSKKKTGGKRK